MRKPIIFIYHIVLFLCLLNYVGAKAQGVVDLSNQRISYGDDFFELLGMSEDKNKVILPKLKCKQAEFVDGLWAKRLKFGNQVTFEEATFEEACRFAMVEFREEVSFARTFFVGRASFYGCSFQKKLDFSNTTFIGDVNLANAKFVEGIDLTGAQLPHRINFSKVDLSQCKDTIDFTPVHYNRSSPHRINLANTNVYKIKLDYTYFELYFGQATKETKMAVYQSLLFMQRMLGFTAGYQKLAREYNDFVGKKEIPNVASKASKTTHRSGNIFIIIILGVILSVVLGLAYLSNSKTSVGSPNPSTMMQPLTKSKSQFVDQSALNYFANKVVPLANIEENEREGTILWASYQLPKDTLNEAEEFWSQYERLLAKVKYTKG